MKPYKTLQDTGPTSQNYSNSASPNSASYALLLLFSLPQHVLTKQWAIFDLAENPVPTYAKSRVAISGDAAHATSPHHGSGAGFCIEDTAVLAALLSDRRVHSHADLETVLSVFDASRRERTQWLVQSSRFIGDCYEWRAEGVGRDFRKIEEAINRRCAVIMDVDVQGMCEEASGMLSERLGGGSEGGEGKASL